jgi:DNA-binding NtrC family response regulator/pSer/pThr/pTyr-binding forkhead associated (FHA) protein
VPNEDRFPTEASLPVARPQETPSSRFSLLVMSEAGVFMYSLPEHGEVTIGRGEKCDVQIRDAKASRLHAVLRVGDVIEVVDQGSTNGTKVGDRPIASRGTAPLAVGDMITIGTTVLTLKRVRAQRPPTRVYSGAAFRALVEREQSADGAKSTGFAIIQVRLTADSEDVRVTRQTTGGGNDVSVAAVESFEATLAEVLRPSDVVGSYAPGVYTVLLPETAPDVASSLETQLRAELRAHKLQPLVGLACYPRDGQTLDALVEMATGDLAEPTASPASQLDQGAMQRLAPMIDRVAAGRINVLILGETGVGKEVMARTLHVRSARALGPLVYINCAAFSETLLESEIFGHEKGAFTGALQAKVGLLESANGGTVFLDEVGEMPLSLQAKLLRVLEQREVLRVGSLRPRAIDVRFLSATNRDLEVEIREGRFRQDLFFRLNGMALRIPPLRDRVEEIEGLANAFAQQAAEAGRRDVPVITRPVLTLLKRYSWPGNIRELRNVMERAVVLSSGAITLEHMPAELMGPVVPLSQPPAGPARAPMVTLPPEEDPLETTAASTDGLFRPGMTDRERVVAALDACEGNQTHAARILGIARRTLIMRIEEYGLPRPRKKDSPGT